MGQAKNKKPTNPDKTAQSQMFIKSAREIGADQDEEAFKRSLRRIAKTGAPKVEKK